MVLGSNPVFTPIHPPCNPFMSTLPNSQTLSCFVITALYMCSLCFYIYHICMQPFCPKSLHGIMVSMVSCKSISLGSNSSLDIDLGPPSSKAIRQQISFQNTKFICEMLYIIWLLYLGFSTIHMRLINYQITQFSRII